MFEKGNEKGKVFYLNLLQANNLNYDTIFDLYTISKDLNQISNSIKAFVFGMQYKSVIDMIMKTKRPIKLVFASVTFDETDTGTNQIDEENPFLS